MTTDEKKTAAKAAVDEIAPLQQEVCSFIFEHPELGNQEFVSSAYLADKMRDLGFEVAYPYAGVPTALRADLKCGEGPTIAVLAEYDALPGYGPMHDQPAHACGHNWISASCYGVCAALSRVPELVNVTISLIAAPAEETTGGKIDVINAGGYNDVDAAIQFHLGNAKTALEVHSLAMDSIEFTFHGKAAHAAMCPEQGINALDAVNLTYAGINCLRQHVTSDIRIHGIITEGGKAANVVPDLCQCRFYIRGAEREELNKVTERVINVARGAALMTGCELEWRNFENSYDNNKFYPKLKEAVRHNLEALGDTDFRDKLGGNGAGSSDIGNVSQIIPTCYVELATGMDDSVTPHSDAFLQVVTGPLGFKSLDIATKAMAMTAIDIWDNPELLTD